MLHAYKQEMSPVGMGSRPNFPGGGGGGGGSKFPQGVQLLFSIEICDFPGWEEQTSSPPESAHDRYACIPV